MEKQDDYTAKLFEGKKQFRAAALRERDALSEQQRRLKSSLIIDRLCSMHIVQESSLLFVYVSFASEVETHSLIRMLLSQGKRVCVPCIERAEKKMTPSLVTCMEHDLAPGCFGILEPVPGLLHPVEATMIDIVIVPGSAFTAGGVRIGYGGGYYDRFLKNCPAVTIGIAFDMQIVAQVPHDVQWDVPLDYVITERRIIQPSHAGPDRSRRE